MCVTRCLVFKSILGKSPPKAAKKSETKNAHISKKTSKFAAEGGEKIGEKKHPHNQKQEKKTLVETLSVVDNF